MAEETDEQKTERANRRKELAEAFADGMEIFSNREAERKAKEQPANPEGGNNDGGSPDGGTQRKSFSEWLLG